MKQFGFTLFALMIGVVIGNFTSIADASSHLESCRLSADGLLVSATLNTDINAAFITFHGGIEITDVIEGPALVQIYFDRL